MLIHAGFLPHSPLLLDTIHPENRELLEETEKAISELEADLYTLKPDVLVVISGHGERYSEVFSLDLASVYKADLKPFGDLSDPMEFKPSFSLADKLQRTLRRDEIPFTLTTNEELEYGTSVVLKLLANNLRGVRILPIAYSDLPAKSHLEFGEALREVIEISSERIAVIATGDLSHCLSSDAPGGFCKEGQEFDAAVVQALSQQSASALLAIPEDTIHNAQESGYQPLVSLIGMLGKTKYKTEILSYESPLGVGYLVAQFHVR